MRIEVHDVDHGGCAVVTGPQGHRLMLDCGLSVGRSWFPSIAYRGQRIDTLMLTNLDEDHCEDLEYLWDSCPLGAIVSNPTVGAPALRAMKVKRGMRGGVTKASEILDTFGHGLIGNWAHDLGGVQWFAFWNRYATDFTDTNNLSLAVFVCFGHFTILFGGDMEQAGWRKLITRPNFRALWSRTQVYVASHHGRENGCCNEMFDLFKPQLVLFSDGPMQHETQETHAWYRSRTTGIPDYSRPGGIIGQPLRRVMTTRKDGTITIDVKADGAFLVTPSKNRAANAFAEMLAGLGPATTTPAWPLLGAR